MTAVYVTLLGALGSLCRYAVGELGARATGGRLPAGTLVVNVLGSMAIGAVMTIYAARGALQSSSRVALTAGFLGGFTTYSAFCYETWSYVDRGAYLAAAVYFALTTVACFAGCAAGVWLVRVSLGT